MKWVSVASALVAVAGTLVAACGPSVQSVYEGNVRFEHCYRLDLDPNIAPPHREACWTEWLEVYPYGQTTDRVEYARRRLAELKGSQESMVLRVDTLVRSGPPAAPAEAPAPSTVHRPPPPTADASWSLAQTGAPSQSEPPGQDCLRQCEALWRSCQNGCSTGTQFPLCEGCATDYRSCVQRCLN